MVTMGVFKRAFRANAVAMGVFEGAFRANVVLMGVSERPFLANHHRRGSFQTTQEHVVYLRDRLSSLPFKFPPEFVVDCYFSSFKFPLEVDWLGWIASDHTYIVLS